MALAEKPKISVADYLQGELSSDIRHEYGYGEMYAMSGAKRSHNIISMNLAGIFLLICVDRPVAPSMQI